MYISLTLAAAFSRNIPVSPEQYPWTRGSSYWIPLPWIFPTIQQSHQTKVSQTVPQNITSQNRSILSSLFLFSSIAVDSTLAQHSLNLFHHVSAALHLPRVWARHREPGQAPRALSLLPFLLLLSCLISGLCKTLPPASLQHTAGIFTFQFLLILTFFLPLFLSF